MSKVLWFLLVCSVLAGVGTGFGAYTTGKFPIWGCCLWGVFTLIGAFISGFAGVVVADTLCWVTKHREEDDAKPKSGV